MKSFYIVQHYPYEDWVTLAQFETLEEANALHDKLVDDHSKLANQFNNFKVREIADNATNRNYFRVYR